MIKIRVLVENLTMLLFNMRCIDSKTFFAKVYNIVANTPLAVEKYCLGEPKHSISLTDSDESLKVFYYEHSGRDGSTVEDLVIESIHFSGKVIARYKDSRLVKVEYFRLKMSPSMIGPEASEKLARTLKEVRKLIPKPRNRKKLA